MKHNEKMENIKEWSDTTENQELKYPVWFKDRLKGHIVEFTDDRIGTVVYVPTGSLYEVGYYAENWASHINDEDYYWIQVENPNKTLDDFSNKIIKEAIEEDYKNSHYKAQKIDTILRCKANMTLEQQKAICIFNIDRYLHREKGQNLSDIQKIKYYLNWLEEIEKGVNK